MFNFTIVYTYHQLPVKQGEGRLYCTITITQSLPDVRTLDSHDISILYTF